MLGDVKSHDKRCRNSSKSTSCLKGGPLPTDLMSLERLIKGPLLTIQLRISMKTVPVLTYSAAPPFFSFQSYLQHSKTE